MHVRAIEVLVFRNLERVRRSEETSKPASGLGGFRAGENAKLSRIALCEHDDSPPVTSQCGVQQFWGEQWTRVWNDHEACLELRALGLVNRECIGNRK